MADSSSSLSPEKRLLQLIESGGKEDSAGAPPKQEKAGGKAKPAPVSLKDRWLGTQKFAQEYVRNFRSRFGIRTANKVARVVLAVLIFFTVINALYEIRNSGKDPLIGLDAPDRKMTTIDFDEPAFDAGDLYGAGARNVFLPFAKREEMQTAVGGSGSLKLVEMTKTLKLAGISFNPEDVKANYCMIEDLQKNITVFLREGDRISGVKIARILEESVELEYDNEKMEIR